MSFVGETAARNTLVSNKLGNTASCVNCPPYCPHLLHNDDIELHDEDYSVRIIGGVRFGLRDLRDGQAAKCNSPRMYIYSNDHIT